MTNLLPYATIQNTAGEGAGAPGAAPVGATMQGNPQSSQFTPSGNYLPGNQNAPQQLTATQISAGNIVTSSVPTNVNTQPGTDSLLAQMSRGQVIMADSTYGQSQFVPANGGAGQPPGVAGAVPVSARTGNALTYPATQQNYTGN
jgi:hypothetical protein